MPSRPPIKSTIRMIKIRSVAIIAKTTIPVGWSDICPSTGSHIGITPVNIYVSTVIYVDISITVVNIGSFSVTVFNV